jgi:tetratricopeptide (TPR) repeat protein
VIGRAFWTGPLYALLDDGARDLRVLEDRDFIRRRSGSTLAGEVEYAFKHALTREVAYDSLTRARRAQLHARFGEWLETTIGDEAAALLAHHYAEAVRPADADIAWAAEEERLQALVRRAVHWLRRAGELAFSRYELEDAIALFSRALELGPTTAEQIDLYELLGRAHAFRFDGEAFWDAIQRALDRTTDPRRQADLYTLLTCETAGRAGMWRTMPGRDLVEGWVRRAVELSEPDSTTSLRALVGGFWFEVVDADTAAKAAAKLERRGGRGRIDALDTQKVLAFRRTDYEETLRLAEEELRAADELGDPEIRAGARESTVGVFTLCGRISEAERLAHEYGAIVERFSPHHRLHAVAIELELEEVRGDWRRIVELLPTTRAVVADNLDTPCIRNTRSLLVSAAAAQLLGDERLARELEAQTESRAFEMRGQDDILLGPRLRLALARNDLETVVRLANSPDARRRQVWFFPGAAASYLDALAALRDPERVEREALAIGKEGTVLRPFALRALGLARGDESLIMQAADDFERLRLPFREAETRTLVG